MSSLVESFSWLRKHHPDAHAGILKSNCGNMFAAAANWRELQEQIQQRGVMTERVRCMDHILITQQRGAPLSAVRAAVVAGTPGVQLPPLEPLPARSVMGLAQSIVDRALTQKGIQ